ncbi:MAG: hypothetical protein ACXVFK_09185 [Solirubrobacteraceae bacterium]
MSHTGLLIAIALAVMGAAFGILRHRGRHGREHVRLRLTPYRTDQATAERVVAMLEGGRALPPGELRLAENGEILMSGPHVFHGYFHDPEATAATVVDGWLHTGDLGSTSC